MMEHYLNLFVGASSGVVSPHIHYTYIPACSGFIARRGILQALKTSVFATVYTFSSRADF